MTRRYLLPLESYGELTGEALVLVTPGTWSVILASDRAKSLLTPGNHTAPETLLDMIQWTEDVENSLRMALSSSQHIVAGVVARTGGERLTVKMQRYDHGQVSPMILLVFDSELEFSRRFRSLTEQLLSINDEVERRRAAEQTLSKNMSALRRSLDGVRIISEITTAEGQHLELATEAVASLFSLESAVFVLRTASIFQCVSATGGLKDAIPEDAPLDLDVPSLLAQWTRAPAARDDLIVQAVGQALGAGAYAPNALVLPLTVSGAPTGALVCFPDGSAQTSGITDYEIGIISEALGNLLARADMEARLIHGQKLEAVGKLTGGIAHDFNNILSVVLGNAELLLDVVTSADADFAQDIHDAAQRGAVLTSRLLAFARKQPLRPEATDINGLLRNIDLMIRRTIGADVDLQVVVGGGLWKAVIDPNQLETAVLNLAVNARDAMPDGGRLTIETANARLDEDYAAAHEEVMPGQYVVIAVSDTGTGMTSSVAAQAVTPFFTTKEVGKGSGLGLSMVSGFVKQSGGHLKIYTEPGRGTTMRMYLPRDHDDTSHASLPSAQDETLAAMGRGLILLVEDDEAVLKYTKRTLLLLGYSVDTALNGPEAFDLLDRKVYDLVLTDVVLSGKLNGRDVAEHAGGVSPGTAILFMSGYTENAIVHHGRLDPGAELLSKPFTRNRLAQKIKDLIGG